MGWRDRAYNQGDAGGGMGFSFPVPTPLAIVLMLTCVVVFIAQAMTGPRGPTDSPLFYWGSLSFYGGEGIAQPWRFITYQYLHAGGLHIFFNLLTLYFFVPPLERMWGWKKTLAFYTGGGVAAGVLFGIMSVFWGNLVPLIGASGSIMAAIGACAYFFPEQQVFFFLFLVPIRVLAILLAVLYLLLVVGDRSLSDVAHLGGMAYGFLLPWGVGPMWYRFERRIQARKLRRVASEEEHEEEVVDRILQKVHDSGMHSLNWRERRVLRKATERQRKRDMEMAKKRAY